jgi:hypothetical protein
MSGQPLKYRLGFVQLFIVKPRDRGANSGLRLELPNIINLTFGLRFRACRKVFPHAFSIQPTADPKNDFPGRIREL